MPCARRPGRIRGLLLLEAGRKARERLAEPKVEGLTHTHTNTYTHTCLHMHSCIHTHSVSSQKHLIASR